MAKLSVAAAEKKPKASKQKKWSTPKERLGARAGGLLRAATRLHQAATKWGLRDLAEDAQTALVAARAAMEEVGKLPDDWSPPKRSAAETGPIAIGDVVEVRTQRRYVYEDLIGEAEMTGLRVLQVSAKGKLLVETGGGNRMFLPRAHVRRQEG